MAEDHDGSVLGPARERLVQPLQLIAADAGPRPGHAAVQRGHVPHPLLGAHLLRGPVVRTAAHGVEADEADALVVERPVRLAEESSPFLAHVQVPVVLAGDEDLPDLHLFQDVVSEVELDWIAELGEVASVDQEVRGWVHCLNLLHRAHRLVHEPCVDVLRVEMAVGDPGELERRLLRACLPDHEIERADEREPAVGCRAGCAPRQQRPVQEHAARDPHGAIRSLA